VSVIKQDANETSLTFNGTRGFATNGRRLTLQLTTARRPWNLQRSPFVGPLSAHFDGSSMTELDLSSVMVSVSERPASAKSSHRRLKVISQR